MSRLNENGSYCVYVHTSPSNKAYIGITSKDTKERWGSNGYRYKNNKRFWNAIQKYGWDNFKHEILFENLAKEDACAIEVLLIALFNTQNPALGYNISPGGEFGITGCHLSDETKQKISKSHIGVFAGKNNPMYGISPKERMDEETYDSWLKQTKDRVTSKEFKEKMRQINIGKKYSDETNKKKGRRGEDHPWYGKHHTEDTKEKLRQARIGKKDSEETKQKKREAMTGDALEKMKLNQPNRLPIMCIETGQIFNSISDASRQLGISRETIYKCLNNTYKYNVKKYNFVKVSKEDVLNGNNSARL